MGAPLPGYAGKRLNDSGKNQQSPGGATEKKCRKRLLNGRGHQGKGLLFFCHSKTLQIDAVILKFIMRINPIATEQTTAGHRPSFRDCLTTEFDYLASIDGL